MMPYWETNNSKNSYWESLSGVHSMGISLAFLEILIKAGMAGLMIIEFRKMYPLNTNELFNLNYTLVTHSTTSGQTSAASNLGTISIFNFKILETEGDQRQNNQATL